MGSAYLTMLQSGSIRTMVGSSTYRKSRSCGILALSTCTVTFVSSTSSEDVVLQTMEDGERLQGGKTWSWAPGSGGGVVVLGQTPPTRPCGRHLGGNGERDLRYKDRC